MLDGTIAVVTGGSRGIGYAIVTRFVAAGATVYYFSRSPGDPPPAGATHVTVDVANDEQVTAAINTVIETHGKVDVLVNNAGVTRDGLIMRMKSEDWQTVLDTNLSSAFYTSRAVARQMIKQRSGSIINISSVVGKMGNGGQANYAASKAGLIGLTKSVAREVGSRGVRVNAVAPGFIETDMTGGLNDEQRATLTAQIPMARIGTPDEIASVCLFLASDLASYITGEVITVGGGLAM